METTAELRESDLTSPTDTWSGFVTREGIPVPQCSWSDWCAIMSRLQQQDDLSPLQSVETAGFSLAMVIRFALGHTSAGGALSVFAADSFFGWIAVAGARHLLNSGCSVRVLLPQYNSDFSPIFTQLLTPLDQRGATLYGWSSPEWGEIDNVVESSHAVLCGLADAQRVAPQFHNSFAEQMNESRVPVHCIGAPIGISPEVTPGVTEKLFASSTLSVGLPLTSLQNGPDMVGRHYLCDAGWSLADYLQLGYGERPLFCEQPVVQLQAPPDTENS